MKLIHLSDLHLGKRLIEFPLLQDQQAILNSILTIVDDEKADAVLIAGDVYDRSNPAADAMQLFSDFIHQLRRRSVPVLIISGNHDSPDRLAYFRELAEESGIRISPVYDGHIEPVTLPDEHGSVHFWLMPYVCPQNVRRFFPDEQITTMDDAVRAMTGEMQPDPAERNVILAHCFVKNSQTGGSEHQVVGTIEDVQACYFDAFDYVALGHIHRMQRIGREDGSMRYCGTPLKYSRDEAASGADKTVSVVELGAKGDVRVRAVPLRPLHEVRVLKGTFDELLAKGPAEGCEEDYYYITLTDEEDILNAAARLRVRYPRMVNIAFDNKRTRQGGGVTVEGVQEREKTPLELLQALYKLMHGEEMSDDARSYAEGVIREMGGMQE